MRRDDRTPRPARQSLIIAVLAFSGMCGSFMFTLVVPLQVRLPDLLNASREDAAWVLTATLLSAAVITPIAGRLGDMYGKRRIMLVLLASNITGSVLAALAPEINGVILGRTLQGAMIGTVPLGISILRDIVDERRVSNGVALISATLGMGGALGMPISAFVSEYADWRMLFATAAILGILVFILTLVVVPESAIRAGGRFDLLGALWLAAALVCILMVVSRGNEWGWTSPPALCLAIGGVLLLVGWAWYELRAHEPLLDLRVAARPAVLLTNIVSIAMGFAYFVSNVVYPQVLTGPESTGYGFGLPLLIGSFCIMPAGLAMMALSPAAGRIGRSAGPKALLLLGASTMTSAYVFNLFFVSEVWHVAFANLLVGAGLGLSYAAMPMLIMRSVPVTDTGASNGLNALFRSVGTSGAGAVVGAVLASSIVVIDGHAFPAADTITVSLALGAGVAGLGALVSVFVPGATPQPRRIDS